MGTRPENRDEEIRDDVLALQETSPEAAEDDVQAHTSTASYFLCGQNEV